MDGRRHRFGHAPYPQAGVNGQLRVALGHPLVAATASFVVGTIALVVVAVATRVQWPSMTSASQVPWWGWIGGLFGAVYIAAMCRVGATFRRGGTGCVDCCGQLLAALMFDHFGLVGFARQSVTPVRGFGALLLFAGVYLIQRK